MPNQARRAFLNYNRTSLNPGQIKPVANFGTLFACESITNAQTNQPYVGGLAVRLDNGPWCPFVANRGFRLDSPGHQLEITNASVVPIVVGFYLGDADMFTIT